MPRIRSIHPGLFTDESFVSVSDAAQIFYIGLLTEADDQGVFEWKPVTLKMRLRPASLQPVDGLLAELEASNRIVAYEIGGRKYGAIRNFRKFQRPKYPNANHPITDDIRRYVGLSDAIPAMDGVDEHPVPRSGECNKQMEDGGGRREDGEKDGQGESKPEKETRSPRARGAPTASKAYAFEGAIVRLTQADLDRWRGSYGAIPDIVAELRTIDAKLVDAGESEKWFGKVSGWLRNRHETLLAQQRKPNGASFTIGIG